MKKMVILLFVFVVGLMGCRENPTVEDNLEQQVMAIENQVEGLQQQVTYTNEQGEETKPLKQPTINLIDPNTLKVIQTLSPLQLGYEMDIAEYIKKVEQLVMELARGTETMVGYDQKMVLDKFDDNGQIIKGQPKIVLRESELIERIMEISSIGGDIYLPLLVTESSYLVEDAYQLNDTLVASYTTYFKPGQSGRNKNIELSAEAIHNVIVGGGDYFFFNTMVGPRTKERGYQPAPEIIKGEIVMGIGGGICQTSSTLFNAVDQIPVTIVERHHHSLDIGYVPKGRDATVAYGVLDFTFQNTSGVPFLIKTVYGNGFLRVEVRTSEEYEVILKAV
ncbi:VanW family protein [Lysinibacillus sp. LZ02]|uniref:VanW family protein n=1 Tax=Lysinibacillus sp. LZ02 TaxID=3420668 RepID=UPI003D35B9DA